MLATFDTQSYIDAVAPVIRDFLTGVQKYLVDYLATNNRNATGGSSNSIQLANISQGGGQLVGSGSIEFVFRGRAPGGLPPISNIIDWCNARGIPRAAAWAIAKIIAREGTKLYKAGGANDNALLDALSDDKINELTKNISNLVAIELSSGISGIL